MSNTLLRAAHRVSGLPAMARQVLVVLADEARDARGGRSSLTTAQIADRTGLSRRTIHRAYVILTDAGQITREETAPGAALATVVHPRAVTGSRLHLAGADLAEGPATVSDPLCQSVRGSIEYNDRPDTSSPRASAREADFQGFRGPVPEGVPPAPPEPPPVPPVPVERELDPVDQVFAAWDGWRDRAGLPGPLTRNAARRVAVARAIDAHGLGKVLMMVDTVERGVRDGKFRRNGQDSIWATFDAAFEVGHAKELNLLARLFDGEFGAVEARASHFAPANEARKLNMHDGEPPAAQALRARLVAAIDSAHLVAAWIDPLRFEKRDDGWLAIAPSAFVADWVAANYASELRRAAGGEVRILTREKV